MSRTITQAVEQSGTCCAYRFVMELNGQRLGEAAAAARLKPATLAKARSRIRHGLLHCPHNCPNAPELSK